MCHTVNGTLNVLPSLRAVIFAEATQHFDNPVIFTGTIYCEGTSIVPEDTSRIAIHVNLNSVEKGSGPSPTGESYSVQVTAVSSEGQ